MARRRSSRSTQMTSNAEFSSIRCAVRFSSDSTARAGCLRTASASSGLISPMPSRARRVAASTSVSASASAAGRPVVSRPGTAWARPSAERVAGLREQFAPPRRPQTTLPGARPGRVGPASVRPGSPSSPGRPARAPRRSTSSSCGGMMWRPASMSNASRLWFVTTMSTSRARSRDASAKHSAPNGQRAAPTHSRAGIDTRRHAFSSTPGSSSSRSPVSVSVAHSRSRGDLPPQPARLTEPLRAPTRAGVEQAVRLLGLGSVQLRQAQVVVATLEHGERRSAAQLIGSTASASRGRSWSTS